MKRSRWQQVVRSAAAAFLALLFTFGSVMADEIETIKAHIKDNGAKWEAGDTSMTQLPDHERKKRVGTLKPAMALTLDQTQVSASYLTAPSGS